MKFATLVTLAISTATALAAPAPEVAARQSGCEDIIVYFARGTTEIGVLGTVVGPGLRTDTALYNIGKDTDVIGIDYPAVVSDYLAGGDPGGARTMATLVTQKANACPNTKIFMSGYSQGAQVTHLAARQLPQSILDRVTGVITFGDPYEDDALPGGLENRRLTFCNFGDLICSGLPTILPQHLTYNLDTNDAARWIRDRV